jgi:DNA-directed RNA polymerase subunit M/transcription elongation factor TFIIS
LASKFEFDEATNIALRLEEICYDKAKNDMRDSEKREIIYRGICLRVWSILDPQRKNYYLISGIKLGDITLKDVVYKNSILLDIRNNKLIKRAQIRGEAKIEKKVSTYYPCPKCKAREALKTTKQVRASDEGMTTFLVCLKCDYEWHRD